MGSFLFGAALGAAGAVFYLRARMAGVVAEARGGLEMERAALQEQVKAIPELKEQVQSISPLRSRVTELETLLSQERKASVEKLGVLEEARTNLSNEFKALSAQALRSNNEQFLSLARTTLEKFQEGAKGELEKKELAIAELVRPVRESLDKVDRKVQDLEAKREGAYQGLQQQIELLLKTQHELRSETGNLVKALRSPGARGRWGELQLKRVVEMAGMVEHCDFEQQTSVTTEDGMQRPDLVVRLPAGRSILVDAKTPLDGYLKAMDTHDEALKRSFIGEHTRQIRAHMAALGRKAYWERFSPAPEFIILFLPAESFFSAALEHDPGLIEAGLKEKVLLATPTTLIALLRAVAYGWRQEKLAENAQEICDLGSELYKRLADLADHWTKVGKSLGSAVDSYNRAVGTLEARVFITARKFKELKASPEKLEIEELAPVDQSPRLLQAPEFTGDLFGK